MCDFQNRMILPFGKKADLTYYKPRREQNLIPAMRGFIQQWYDACKDPAKQATSCNFDYSGLMTEQQALGLVAYRVGAKLEYDGVAGKVTNSEKANELLRRHYREGWKLNG